MEIKGLSPKEHIQQNTRPDLNDDVDVAVEALSLLTNLNDMEKVREQVAKSFRGLFELGIEGIPYIHLPPSMVSLSNIVSVLDAGRGSQPTELDHRLWTPGSGPGSYTKIELETVAGLAHDRPHARIAEFSKIASSNDRLLHYLGLTFDGEVKDAGSAQPYSTQLEELRRHRATNKGLNVVGLGATAIGFLALMSQIKGERLPLAGGGVMVDANLPRKTIDDRSVLGVVNLYTSHRVGHLCFSSYEGGGRMDTGVGISVGIEADYEAEAA
jgi:hypothetical protein